MSLITENAVVGYATICIGHLVSQNPESKG